MDKQPNEGVQVPLYRCVFMFLFVMCAWMLDMSVTCMNNGLVLFNGAWTLNPAVGYHLGLYGMLIITFTMVIMRK